MEEARTITGRAHPETSHEAAASIAGQATILRERVFTAIEEAGEEGRTADEIEEQTHIIGNTCRPRIKELRQAGRITRTDRKRLTRSGRNAFVYIAGLAPLPEPPPVRSKGGTLCLDLEF